MSAHRGRHYLFLFLAAWREFGRNNCPYMAAGIAYWTVLSLFPLIIGGLAVLGFVFASPEEQRKVVDAVLDVVPVSEDFLLRTLEPVMDERGTLGVVAALGSLWSGVAVFSALRRGINHTWQVRQPRNFLVGRAVDFLMFVALAAAALLLLVYTTIGNTTVESLPDWAAGLPVFGFSTRILVELGALIGTWWVFLLLYRFVPNTKVDWADLWLGATVGAVLFQGIRLGFAWFAANMANFNVVYGALGAIVAVMVWAYISALAVLLGAQVAASYSKLMGSRASPESISQLDEEFGDLVSPAAWRRKLRQIKRKLQRFPPFRRALP